MSAIYILWLRELKRYTRSRAQIIASLGQPMLYLLVLGFVNTLDVRPELIAALGVEAERGFVEEQNFGRMQKAARDL